MHVKENLIHSIDKLLLYGYQVSLAVSGSNSRSYNRVRILHRPLRETGGAESGRELP